MKREDRLREIEEPDDVVTEKCKILADLLKKSKCTLVYTGAGISTAASIPDYRGPNGVWTLAEKGIVSLKCADPVQSEPTASHMILKEMCRSGLVRHVLSQNCDGLHLRSGLPQKMLSEIHGNMHIEVCQHCDPPRQYVRPYDVTQKSQYRRHGTGRMCEVCNNELIDTIVHFGEAGKVPWPLNWNGILSLIDGCDLILCIGTSLAVLKEYHFLWPKGKRTPQIVIVNLQWTPKDKVSCLKINAKCDVVMGKLADLFSIPIRHYCRNCDPVLNPKRTVRLRELMERVTDCTCRNRMPQPKAIIERQQPSNAIPGWWAFEIQKAIKRSAQVSLRTTSGKRRRSGESQRSNSSDSIAIGDLNDKTDIQDKVLSSKTGNDIGTENAENSVIDRTGMDMRISTKTSCKEGKNESSATIDPAVAECLSGVLQSLKKDRRNATSRTASKIQKLEPAGTMSVGM